MTNKKYNLIAPCLFGTEKTTSSLLKKYKIQIDKVEDGRVYFTGNDEEIAIANIFHPIAERILINVGQFKATSFQELIDNVKALDIRDYLQYDYKFPISKVKTLNSKLASEPAIQRVVKRAMAENMKSTFSKSTLPETSKEVPFGIFINKDFVTVYIDTTGPSLHKRGYRELTVKAPVRETIAAFMVDMSRYDETKFLCDPMCGSGTIAIEAAMRALGIQPGVNREFAGETLPFIDKKAFVYARQKALSMEKDVNLNIKAYDIDTQAIEVAKENAAIAGVDHVIEFKRQPIRSLDLQEEKGIIITNPPYGKRIMEERSDIDRLYKDMKQAFAKLKDYSYYIISSEDGLGDRIGIKFDKNRKIYNGGIKTYIYQKIVK